MPALIDAFMYNGERDLLAARMQMVGAVVDHLVVVESERTFTGRPKPLHWEADRAAVAGVPAAVTYVRAELAAPGEASAWDREHAQRSALRDAIATVARDDDVVLLGDVDELPRPAVLADLLAAGPAAPCRLHLDYRQYYVNWKMPHVWDVGPLVFRWRDRDADVVRSLLGDAEVDPYAAPVTVVPDAGWHLTFLGGPDAVRRKLGQYSHTELDTALHHRPGFVEACLHHRVELRGHYVMDVVAPADDAPELAAVAALDPAYVRPHPGTSDARAEAFRRLLSTARGSGLRARVAERILASRAVTATATAVLAPITRR